MRLPGVLLLWTLSGNRTRIHADERGFYDVFEVALACNARRLASRFVWL